MADEFKIVASLNIPESASRINQDIPKLEGQAKHLKIVADLNPTLSIKNIQATLNKMNNNANIKIGIDTSGLNSVQGATQNITNNLKNVQTQAQQTASAVRDIGNVGISDNVFKKLLQDMQISKSVTNEYKQSLRALANELTTAWDTRNEELYLAKLKEIINVIGNGQKSFKLFDKDSFDFKEITSQITALKSAIGVGVDGNGRKNKFFIDDNLKKELAYIQGSDKAVRSLLNSLYGLGNWTFDERKFGFTNLRSQIDKASASADSLYAKFSNANFGGGNIANFITETAGQIDTLKAKLNTKDTLNGFLQLEMGIANADKQLEIMIADALKLKDFTSRSNDPLGWFEEIITESEKVNSSLNSIQRESRETSIALGEIGHNFISNNQVQATFSSLKQAEEYFKGLNLGKVSVGLNKGSLQGLTDFTIKVKSATGEIERFRYAVNNIGDDQNPILEYNLTNINASNEAVQRLIQSQQKAQDKLKALRTNLTSDLKSIRSAWQDVNGGKSVKSDENIERLKQQYIKVTQAIRELRKADDTTLASMKANADAQIDKLNQMVTQYHNAEKVATQLRARGFETVKNDTGSNIDKFVNSVNNSKVPIQALQTEINKLTSDFAQLDAIQDQAGKSAALTNILNTLDNAKTKFQSLKELFKGFGNADWISVNSEQINKINDMATKIAIYKSNLTATRDEWKSQGIYVGEIQAKVTSLARSLPNIKKPEKFNEWVQEWNDINQKANQLKVNLDSQVATHNKIYEIQSQIAKLNPTKDSAEIARLNEKLSAEQKTLSNLQMQSNVYSNLVSLEQQEQYITEQTVKSRDKLLSATNAGVKQYQTTINNAITTLQGFANSPVFTKNASNPQVTQTKQDINSLITAYQNLATKLQGNITPSGLETVRTELTQLNARFNDATTTAKRFETELRNDNGAEKQAQRIALLKAQLTALEKANPKAMKQYGDAIKSLMATLNSNPDGRAVEQVAKSVQLLRREINNADLASKTFFQNLKEKAAKFTGWMSMTYAISLATRTIRNMITEVVNLDTALIDLKKTFKGTNSDLQDFYYEANNVAKQLGVTTEEVINTASSWSRLGYSTKEAAIAMSKYASMFKMISPDMSMEDSTDGLLSVMKAFDIEVNDVLDGIMSKINKVGNEFGTSNNEIVQMLMRSSSAMKEGNNTLAETIALETSAVEITRDYASVGTAYKTLAMRLRGYDEELETYSNDVQVLSGEIADLTKTAKNPNGVSLFKDDAKTEYKSTLEILRDIREVYDDLDDKTQAQLLEKIAGKRQGQIVAATLSNWDTVEKALVAMENADGSALNEMNTIMESISYRANIFKETLVGIAQGLFNQDFMKSMVDSGTRVLNVFDDLSPSISFILEKFASLLELVTKLADTIGGIPTLMLGIGIKSIGNIKTWLYELKEVQMAINGISALSTSFNGGTNMFADTAVVTQYANQLRGLSAQQVELALSTKLLTAEQKQQIMAELGLIASENKIQSELLQTTLAQAGLSAEKQKAVLDGLNLINVTTGEVVANKACTKSELEKRLALEGVTVAQTEQIMSTLGMSTANATATVSFKLLSKSILSSAKAMGVWLTTTPAGWATIAVTAISAVVLGINAYNKKQEEAIQNAKDMADKTSSQISEMDKLVSEYEAIIDSEKSETEKTEELNEWKQNLVETYGFEKDKLEELNTERERGIELLKEEIDAVNQRERGIWLAENSTQFTTAKEKITNPSSSSNSRLLDGSVNSDIFTKINQNNIRDSIKNKFNSISTIGNSTFFDFKGENLIETYDNLQNLLSALGNAKNLSDDEKRLLKELKKEEKAIKKVLDDYQVIYETGYKYLAQNNFEDFAKENPIDNIGKENYLSWRKGLLDTAQGDKELASELETLVTNQFPDLEKYFNNLAIARSMFAYKVNSPSDVKFAEERDNFLLSLSDEDLEIATQIPDLFADGLEGATKKIEAWKKQNSIETEVKITIDEALEGQTNKIKAITSAMEDMTDTGYITSETYAELAKLGGNFTDCLEWENGKLKLNVDKLKDLEIQQLATAKSANSLAISELELKAASLAAHGQDFSDIQAQIESLMKENAVYTQLMEEIANAKPDDKSSSEKSEEPESVTQFKKALAEKEHLLNTNQISEQDYYEWLDSESKRVYGNLKDYEEDLWKYEEQVYKWRQEQEEKLFDKKIENYKKLSDNALDKYIDSDGNELTVNASFDYARSQINSAITETQNRINELSLKKGFEDEIEELTSDLEGLYDTLEDINKQEIESQKEYIQTLKDEYSDLMDEQIDQQKKLSEEIEKSYENRISAIDKQIDALNKVSEAEERQKSILEAEKDVKEAMLELDKAKTKKRLVYSGDGSWQLKEDKSAVKEAQDNLAEKQESLEEAKQDEQIAKLEEQKELLETQKDNSKEYYDKVVEDLESQKEAREKQYDILVDIYEQLGGEKRQTSLNDSLVEKLTSNGDINKAVQGLTPTEIKQAITSGILTTDSNGNYAIDYSILDKNEQAVKDNTAELEKLNNQLSGKSDTVDSNTPTYNNKNLDAEGYLIDTNGKRVLNDGKPIHAKNFSDEIAKRNTSKKMTDVVKGIGKFAGYDTMQDLIDAMITGEYTIPKAQLSNFMGATISPKISQNIPNMGEYMTNAVNNTAPPINFTVNVDGSADEKTIQAMETKIGNMLINYTDKLTSSIATSSLRRQNKS